jgi:DNA invertase Pin-like site-specific DNA recombinase
MATKHAPQFDGYVRVSRTAGRSGDSFISPQVQRESISTWAKLRGVEIVAWHEDLDQSGGKLDRPGLEALLARIERGETGGVVVAKLDRLSRLGVADALKLVEQIQDAGGSIAAIDVGLDPTTPVGKFAQTLMLALAQMERERIAESWTVAQEHAIERGVPASRTPYGFRKDEDGRLEPDPVDSPHIIEAFKLAASRDIAAATAYLQGNVKDRTWTTSYVRKVLSSRAYIGEIHSKGSANLEAHKPLVTRAIWQAAQQPARTHSRSGDYPLSGIATCGSCGSPMVAGSRTRTGQRMYVCTRQQTFYKREGRTPCKFPASIVAARLEDYVVSFLREGWEMNSFKIEDAPADATDAEQVLRDAEEELLAFAEDTTLRRALGDRYHHTLEARESHRDAALAAFRTQAKDQARSALITPEMLLSDEGLRYVCKAAFGVVSVKRGRGKVEDRVSLKFRGSWLGRQVERSLQDLR